MLERLGKALRGERVGVTRGEETASRMQLDVKEKIEVGDLIDRLENMVGSRHEAEYRELFTTFSSVLPTLSKQDRAQLRLAVTSLAEGWKKTKESTSPALNSLTHTPATRAQELLRLLDTIQ